MRRTDREITGIAEIETIIREADCCHVALCDYNRPYLVALNFGYKPGKPPVFYFHCAPEGKKLDIIRKNPSAAFFLDTGHELVRGNNACDWGMNYKSVSGTGTIDLVTGPSERNSALNCIMEHYSGTSSHAYDTAVLSKTAVLRLTVLGMTGKKKGHG